MSGINVDSGLIELDDFYMTTIGGVTADDALTLANNKAEIELKNTLTFDDSAPSVVKELKIQNSLNKQAVTVKKYSESDTLLLNGTDIDTAVYESNGDILVISSLENGGIYTFEFDPEKITTIAGTPIDTSVFRTGEGLKKTKLSDADGDEIFTKGGKVPSETSKMQLIFTKGTSLTGTPTITAGSYSLTAVQDSDTVYTFDFSGKPLSPDTEYTVKFGSSTAKFTTGAGGVICATPVINASGNAEVKVTNTQQDDAEVYIVSAYFKADGSIAIGVMYE